MESSRQISVRDPVSHRLSDRDDPAKYDLENGMETENPGIFLSDPEFCRERYFRRCIFRRDTATERRVLFTADSVRFYSVRGAFVCCVHADPGTGNRDGPGNVCAGVRSLRRTGRSSASSAPVSDLCSCLFLAGRTCVSAVFWNLEKLWPVPRKKSSLPEAGDHCFWGIYRGDNGRMFSQSLAG